MSLTLVGGVTHASGDDPTGLEEGDPWEISLSGLAAADTAIPILPAFTLGSMVDVSFYGFIKADMTFESALTSGDIMRWVENGGSDTHQFKIAARDSRIGVNLAGPDGKVKTTARLEIDFYGGGDANSSNPRMRHAYVNIECPESNLSFLLGQTTDVVSPLVMPTLNYSVAWSSGNIGFRRNQFRVTKGLDLGNDTTISLAGAVTRAEGEEVDGPGYQGRLGYSFPGIDEAQTTFGFSALSGKDKDGAALDVTIPVCSTTTIKGEYFRGENLETFFGGIGQGENANMEAIESDGFWVAVSHTVNDKYSVNFGWGLEEPEQADLDLGMRSRNSTIFANVLYAVNSATSIGLEFAQLDTEYRGSGRPEFENEDGFRIQLAATFRF